MLDLLLTINTRLTEAHLGTLEEKGLHLVRAMDHNTYRVRGETTASIADIAALPFVEDVQDFAPMQKVDVHLQQAIRMARAVTTAGDGGTATPDVRVLVALEKAMDTAAAVDALAQIGTVEEHSDRRALVTVAPERIADVAQVPGVLSVEKEPDPRTQNNIARGLTHVEPVANDLGLDGAGEIVGVADSGLDTGVAATVLADFAGRVVNIRATVNKAAFGVADGADLNNHGTHVSGSILSDGALSNGNLRGMAPAAEVTMLSMGPNNSTSLSVPADLTTGVFQDAYNDGARIHNNSWGSNGQDGQYTAFSDDVDTFVRDNPDMLVLIAAGNAGPNVGTVSPPGTAKNALTVGAAESLRPLPATININPNPQDDDFNPATPPQNVPLQITNFDQQADDAEDIAVFSGRGPTDDGRIKPDLVAPGSWILSCRSSVSTADVGPDGLVHAALPPDFYADDADGVATHAEAVGRGLPGAPIFGTWNQNTPPAPAGSGALAQDNYFYDSGTSMATPITAGAATLLRQYLRERRGHADPSAALLKALLVNGATVPAGDSNAPDNNRGFGWLNMANTLTPAPTNQQTYSDDVDLAVATGDVRQFSVQIADPSQPFRVTLAWSDAPGANLQNRLYLRVIDPAATVFDGDVTAFPNASNNVQRVHIDAPMAGTYTVEVHGIEVLFGIDAHLPAIRQDFALAVINGIGFSPEPVDVCQVVDRSGSMVFYGYMDPVKERAKQFVDLLRVNDRCGVVSYNHAATTDHAVVPIAGLATQNAIKMQIDALTSGGSTSIGGGLEAGRAAIAAGGDPAHPQALVLLSDGHENTPPWVGGGVTDSPPAWYGGPDFTEILPTLPAGLKVYTVSLGVQSDEVLLQDIATQTGGVFHAIHSPADVGKLHEIYVHLQALTGGEEVIASGSSQVDGVQISTSAAAAVPAANVQPGGPVDRALLADLAGLTLANGAASNGNASGFWRNRFHPVPVDETVEEITLMVSWHDAQAPVSLSLFSPSFQIIKAGDPQHYNLRGSSYQFFRIQRPKSGTWYLMVRTEEKGAASYTWGAYAKTPVGIDYDLPRERIGRPSLPIATRLRDPKEAMRSLRFDNRVLTPQTAIKDLLEKYRDELGRISLNLEPDTPKLTQDLYKLGILDQQLRKEGRRSLFETRSRELRMTRTNDYKTEFETSVAGLYAMRLVAVGSSGEGIRYRREAMFDLRV